jgi:histidinol phosphatase-like enzyme
MYNELHEKYKSMKFEFSRQIFEKYSDIKFSENPSSGTRVISRGWTEGQTSRQTRRS